MDATTCRIKYPQHTGVANFQSSLECARKASNRYIFSLLLEVLIVWIEVYLFLFFYKQTYYKDQGTKNN